MLLTFENPENKEYSYIIEEFNIKKAEFDWSKGE